MIPLAQTSLSGLFSGAFWRPLYSLLPKVQGVQSANLPHLPAFSTRGSDYPPTTTIRRRSWYRTLICAHFCTPLRAKVTSLSWSRLVVTLGPPEERGRERAPHALAAMASFPTLQTFQSAASRELQRKVAMRAEQVRASLRSAGARPGPAPRVLGGSSARAPLCVV